MVFKLDDKRNLDEFYVGEKFGVSFFVFYFYYYFFLFLIYFCEVFFFKWLKIDSFFFIVVKFFVDNFLWMCVIKDSMIGICNIVVEGWFRF